MTAPTVGQLLTPTGVYLGTWTPDDAEWHAARQLALGGSEIGAVLGLSKWESRFSLYHRKLGAVGPQDENPEMEWGKRLEPVVLGKVLDTHPEFSGVLQTGTFVHIERRWQLANPDALLAHTDGSTWLWECKVSRDDIGWGKAGSSDIPVNYLVQVRWYLDVLGLTDALVSVLIAGQDYREFHVTPDPEDTATMRQAGAEFMRTLRERERPNIDEHSATLDVVRTLHPEIDPVDVEITPQLADDYRTALLAFAAAEAAKRQQTALVLDALGRGRRAMCLGDYIALRVPGRGTAAPFLRPSPTLKDLP